ncbi:hypothetical protein BGX38DRAFT_1147412 [Terfezia claveryi]|nr:hypothetical protein BGX38DRAFT_1147412 [Terfezia claveryi]
MGNRLERERSTRVTRQRLDEAISRWHQALEQNEDLPGEVRDSRVDEIEEALKNPEALILALTPPEEQIEESIRVINHPGLSFHSYRNASPIDPDSDESDKESDRTTVPLKRTIPATTPEEDASALGIYQTRKRRRIA